MSNTMTGNKSLYLQIYQHLLIGIQDNKYTDTRLPTEKELMALFKVSRITCKKALDMLAQEGWIRRIPGKGSFMIRPATDGGVLLPSKEQKTIIGVVLSDFSGSYGIKILEGIEQEATQSGSVFMLRRSNGDQEIEKEAINDLIGYGVTQLIIMPVHGEYYNERLLRLIMDKFPVTVIDRQLKSIPSHFVGTDNAEAARKAAEFLMNAGHRQIAYLSPPVENTSALEDRLGGFVQAFYAWDVLLDRKMILTKMLSTMAGNTTEDSVQNDVELAKAFLLENPQVTAAVAAEYNIALILARAAREIGRNVPEELSIICFDSPSNFLGDYEFTHIRQMEAEIGRLAVRTLNTPHENGEIEHIVLQTELISGRSTVNLIE